MKEQKDRYKHAKEELQRVQEDFRSLRERLQVTLQELRFFHCNFLHEHACCNLLNGENDIEGRKTVDSDGITTLKKTLHQLILCIDVCSVGSSCLQLVEKHVEFS